MRILLPACLNKQRCCGPEATHKKGQRGNEGQRGVQETKRIRGVTGLRSSSGDFSYSLCVACGLRVLDWNGCDYATGEAGGETTVCPKQDNSPEGSVCVLCVCLVNVIIYSSSQQSGHTYPFIGFLNFE